MNMENALRITRKLFLVYWLTYLRTYSMEQSPS